MWRTIKQKFTKKYPDKYIIFTNNKQVFSDHLFPKGACIIFGDSMLAGIDENRLKSGKHKAKVRYFPGAPTDDMFDYIKPLLRKSLDYIILHCKKNELFQNFISKCDQIRSFLELLE